MTKKKQKTPKVIEPLKPKLRRRDFPCFRILKVANHKSIAFIKQVFSLERALSVVKDMKEHNEKNIVLPIMYTKSGRRVRIANFEYVVVERVTNGGTQPYTLLRNEYGELVPHYVRTNSKKQDKWRMVYKAPMVIEERFSITNAQEKKTATELYNEYLKPIVDGNMAFCRITISGEYITLDYEGEFEVITTKCESDAIRLYNTLQKMAIKNHGKRILWCGIVLQQNSAKLKKKIRERIRK